MTYETDLAKLATLTPEEWQELLRSTWSAPSPRPIVRIPITRRADVLEQVALGRKKLQIARKLGISASLVSKILRGCRK